ncbi:MAG: hypothetical protein WCK27_21260 [Verrucomicrobiota bacterium]
MVRRDSDASDWGATIQDSAKEYLGEVSWGSVGDKNALHETHNGQDQRGGSEMSG